MTNDDRARLATDLLLGAAMVGLLAFAVFVLPELIENVAEVLR